MRALVSLAVMLPLLGPAQAPPAAPDQPPKSSIVWVGRYTQFEEFLRTAKIVKTEGIKKGVTRPRRVFFAPGGLAGSANTKSIRPSRTADFYDGYRSEIAAYELDKVLGMDMVPPTVERQVGIDLVSVQLWAENCVSYKSIMGKPQPNLAALTRQLRRMFVFDNLIYDVDRNEGNMLIDPVGNLILIDHSRTFDGRAPMRLPFDKEMTAIDRPFLEKLKGLDTKVLAPVLRWVDFGAAPILAQRNAILERFDRLIKERGETRVVFP